MSSPRAGAVPLSPTIDLGIAMREKARRTAARLAARDRSIVILTGNHLSTNPRVVKEAAVLAEVGFDVEVLGAWTSAMAKAYDERLLPAQRFRYTPVIDVAGASRWGAHRLARKIPQKAAEFAFRNAGIESRWQLSMAVDALAAAARKRRAALYIAHSEPALYVARDLLRRGHRVGADFEDWFSEDLLPADRRNRPLRLLKALEAELLQHAAHVTCPSAAMGRALADAYGAHPPRVVRNAFRLGDRARLDGRVRDKRDRRLPSIYWFSQTIGYGRGLEDLIAALPLLQHDAEIHLRGNPVAGFDAWLAANVPRGWRRNIHVHAPVAPDELLSRICEHDIGFAGEMRHCANHELTISNKILHYLVGGIAVVASDMLGHREVAAAAPDAVSVYPSRDPQALAACLNALLCAPCALRRAKTAALAAAAARFCWEREQAALLESICAALGPGTERNSRCAA